MKFQDLYLQSFQRLAQRNLEKMGEKTGLVLSPFSHLLPDSDEMCMRERRGFVPGWRQVLPGAGPGGEKVPHPPLPPGNINDFHIPGPLPEQAQVRLCGRTSHPLPQPQRAVQIKQ